VNAVGVRIERAAGRAVVSSLHAAFSIGGLAGAVLTALLQAHLSVSTHLVGLGVVGLVTASGLAPVLLAGDERVFRGTRTEPLPTALRRAVVVFGIVAACTAFGEGAVTDWGTLFLREVLGAAPGSAAAGYASFSVAMAVGRLAGGRLLDRFGATTVLVAGSLLGAAGALLVAAAPTVPVALIGFAVVGLGLANVFPVAIGRAGALGGPGGVALASTVGYAGLLGGPPLLGFLAQATGMATGFVAISVLAAVAAVLALLAPPEARSASALLRTARAAFARVVLEPAAAGSRRAVRAQGAALDPLWPAEPARSDHRPTPYPGLESITTPLR
jgi:predicted MFS family arabinose efflux permease